MYAFSASSGDTTITVSVWTLIICSMFIPAFARIVVTYEMNPCVCIISRGLIIISRVLSREVFTGSMGIDLRISSACSSPIVSVIVVTSWNRSSILDDPASSLTLTAIYPSAVRG